MSRTIGRARLFFAWRPVSTRHGVRWLCWVKRRWVDNEIDASVWEFARPGWWIYEDLYK